MCRLILLLCTVHAASAFECNLTLVNTAIISVSSKELCEYTNYHIIMLMFCGAMAFVSMIATCVLAMTNENSSNVYGSLLLTFLFAACALGFEAPVVISLILLLIVLTHRALNARVTRVAPELDAIVVDSPELPEVESPSAYQDEIEVDAPSAPPMEEDHLPAAAVEIVVDARQADVVPDAWLEAMLQVLRQLNPSDSSFVLETTLQTGPDGSFVIETTIEKDEECPICYATGNPSDSDWTRTQCGHAFHTACLTAWTATNSTCPMCRTPI